ncbi:MAG: acetate kinase, partial [Candidatus Cloacimonetes bacterium 4572_65]
MPDLKKLLVINCGSSSLKYEVYEMPDKKSLGKGQVERIGTDKGVIEQSSSKGEYKLEIPILDHQKAMELVADALTDSELGIVDVIDEIDGVGHRVVHGGETYANSVIIDQDVINAIDKNSELAPLHNPANLTGIQQTTKLLPHVKQVAVFDTAFHQTLPPAAYLYGLPREYYEKFKIRRYGFHGTSHRYVAAKALEMCKREACNTNIITCHLGNGASITSIMAGKSVDTSMGFTPLAGLLMGTRSGDLDPSIIFY